MNQLLAQVETNLGEPLKGIGPLGLPSQTGEAPTIFNKFISNTVGLLTIIAALWFVFVLISGAIGIMASGGDKASFQAARSRITNGLIGLVVVIAGIFIIELVGWLIGFDLILNPAEFIRSITF